MAMEPKTKLYLLEPFTAVGDDCYYRFVVEAESEHRARDIAQEHGGYETGLYQKVSFWTEPALTSCEELTLNGEEGIRCESVHFS